MASVRHQIRHALEPSQNSNGPSSAPAGLLNSAGFPPVDGYRCHGRTGRDADTDSVGNTAPSFCHNLTRNLAGLCAESTSEIAENYAIASHFLGFMASYSIGQLN